MLTPLSQGPALSRMLLVPCFLILREFLFVAAGGQVCSWGRGEDGQLGHGDANDRDLPTIVTALDGCGVSAINCGADHTTARSDSTRTVYSWGW